MSCLASELVGASQPAREGSLAAVGNYPLRWPSSVPDSMDVCWAAGTVFAHMGTRFASMVDLSLHGQLFWRASPDVMCVHGRGGCDNCASRKANLVSTRDVAAEAAALVHVVAALGGKFGLVSGEGGPALELGLHGQISIPIELPRREKGLVMWLLGLRSPALLPCFSHVPLIEVPECLLRGTSPSPCRPRPSPLSEERTTRWVGWQGGKLWG